MPCVHLGLPHRRPFSLVGPEEGPQRRRNAPRASPRPHWLVAVLALACCSLLTSVSATASSSPRLSLSISQLSASAPGLSASITCLLPLSAPTAYSCSGFATHLTEVLDSFSSHFGLSALAATPIRIEAHFIPFCEEAVDALDRDPTRQVGQRCKSAQSHAGALAFASSVRYWKLRSKGDKEASDLMFVPSCAVKNMASTGKLRLGDGVTALDTNYDVDILIQVRSDWNDWYFASAGGKLLDHQMDLRITLTHELMHGLGMALSGVDVALAPGLALPWHYPPSADGRWQGWTDATPWYFAHLQDRQANVPLTQLAKRIHAWNPEGKTPVTQVQESMQQAAPDALQAAQRLHSLITTAGAVVFQPSPHLGLSASDAATPIVVDSASPNATHNSLVHLDTATYNTTANDIILIPDTAAYAGRTWNATVGPHLSRVLGSLGFPSDPSILGRIAEELTVTHAVPVHLAGERIDVMGWKWNWVKHGPWGVVNAVTLVAGAGVWAWLAKRDWVEVKQVRGWSTLPGLHFG